MLEIEIFLGNPGEGRELPGIPANVPLTVRDFIGRNRNKLPPTCVIHAGAFPVPPTIRYIGIAVLNAVYEVR